MRILHTSDWHLGHTLQDHTREYEHDSFLNWLLDTLEAEEIDALIVCGDIFDSANPSAQSQSMWYGFIAEARRRLPQLDIVAIGGNHDSAARLDAPRPLLGSLRVHVTGGVPYLAGGAVDWDRLIVPLHDRQGTIACLVAAVPFLRQADLPPLSEDAEDVLVEGMRRRYAEAIETLRLRAGASLPIIVTGHCYLSGSVLSELSERKILGGNQHALPVDIFPDDIVYVALGHLHLAQTVSGRETVRYSGSPIPLSVSEIHYSHQVAIVELDGKIPAVRQVTVPRAVEFIRIPAVGSLPVDELITRLEALPGNGGERDRNRWPFLEVSPLIDKPRPGLREEILKALGGKGIRLVRIAASSATETPLSAADSGMRLDEIAPEEVFTRCYRARYPDAPPPEYLAAFSELLHKVEQGEVRL